jgi:hypothetical protein
MIGAVSSGKARLVQVRTGYVRKIQVTSGFVSNFRFFPVKSFWVR